MRTNLTFASPKICVLLKISHTKLKKDVIEINLLYGQHKSVHLAALDRSIQTKNVLQITKKGIFLLT